MNISSRSYLFTALFALVPIFSPQLHAGPLDWLPGVGSEVDEFAPVDEQNRAADALWAEAQKAEANDRISRAVDIYDDIQDRLPGSFRAPQALERLGALEIQRRNFKKGFAAYEDILEKYPDYKNFNHVIAEVYDIALAMTKEKTARHFGFIPAKDLGKAVDIFEKIVEVAPYNEHAPKALMNVAAIHIAREDLILGVDALDRVINNYPDSEQAPKAYLKLADTFSSMVEGPEYDQGATREAISYYQDYIALFENHPKLAEGEEGLAEMKETFANSKYLVGEYYYKHMNNNEAAKIFLNEAITASPDSPSADKARELIARIEAEEVNGEPAKDRSGFLRNLQFWRGDDKGGETEEVMEPDNSQTLAPERERKGGGLFGFWRRGDKKDQQEKPEPAAGEQTADGATADAEPLAARGRTDASGGQSVEGEDDTFGEDVADALIFWK